ncbi:MAG: Tn3 family transposase [Actinomycetota bacterium]|nr:Tn3 family transposase [Actinomycetota bacterium]
MNWNGCGAPAYRREINRQLNKGEAFNALRQRIYFGQHGKIRRADPDAQAVQANALNLVTAAVTCWNTVYLAEVVDQLRQEGWQVTDDQLAHLSPTEWRHINPYGDYRFDLTPHVGRRSLRRPPS